MPSAITTTYIINISNKYTIAIPLYQQTSIMY